MKKSKDPLGWHWERLNTKEDDIIGYYMGKSPLVVEGDIVNIKFEPNSSSSLEGKVIKDISYSISADFTPLYHSWFWTAMGDGGKKTLHVTKKEDIKFEN